MAQTGGGRGGGRRRGARSGPGTATGSPAGQPPPPGGFTLRGAENVLSPDVALTTTDVRLEVKAVLAPSAARAGAPTTAVTVADDDVVEVEFVAGERLWMRGDELRARMPSARGEPAGGTLEVPSELTMLPPGMRARGPVAWAVKALKILGVDLAGLTASEIARRVERRVPEDEAARRKRPGLGLHRCSLATGEFALTEPGASASGSAPFLLFIHGTGSSTWGGFGDLWSEPRKDQLAALRAAYGDRVLAFEHASLSESPIQNALDLTRRLGEVLPAGAKLHLVTHSRGGLVGELLCRAGAAQTSPFVDELRVFAGDHEEQAELLRQLAEELMRARFRVERFVRVACPALGTTLASGRLDRWLSVIGSVASFALPGTPLADTFKDLADFVAAVVKERTEPKTLPGLEAMMPDAPFVRLVNWPRVRVGGDLFVIAGDIDPDAWWKKLIVWLSDRFYDGDHDLVVNTPSMYGGATRQGRALASFHKGADVNHFRYFQNEESARRLVGALVSTDSAVPGFEPLERPVVDIARKATESSAGPRPVVVVLPGIMGSELAAGDDRVWVDLLDIALGGMRQLAIGASGVRPTNVLERYYGAIIAHLASTHRVVPFPYDWRLPLDEEADRLAEVVRTEIKAAKPLGKPVRFLAHSMGGLVARTMIARHPDVWREVCSHPDARLIMLGTPNGGSHAINELLVAQSSMVRKLAWLDVKNNHRELLEIVARFPGVLAMLPKDASEDYFAPATWQRYHTSAGGGWILPLPADLERARATRDLLDRSPIDPRRMVYVAGVADVTLTRMELDTSDEKASRIKLLATTQGDGRVTWASGIPPGVPTYYMPAEHGDLPAHVEAFPAIEELLLTGATTRLSQTAPPARGAELLFEKPPPADELFPDGDVLVAEALGARPRRHGARRRDGGAPFRVEVLHGNLAYTRYPILVGHYAGDTIVSAERDIDTTLGGALSYRHAIGLYPAAVESNAVFVNPRLADDPRVVLKGAIVVGLGTVGNLSASLLTRTVTRGLLEFVLEWAERCPDDPGLSPDGEGLAVSALLIGTGAGGISVKDSVYALVQAVREANRSLAEANRSSAATNRPRRIGRLELVEVWQDRAIQALLALQSLAVQPGLQNVFIATDQISQRGGARRRLAFDEPGGWWQRLQVLGDDLELRFSASTRRARNEVRLLPTERAAVDQFVARSIRTTHDDGAASRTLFELLLPNELKERAPEQDDLVLILNEEAARYPWELLQNGWDRSARPLAVEHGLLRQLEVTTFRESPIGAAGDTALVIGDPISSFPALPGAQEEAKVVTDTLRDAGRLKVETRIRPTSEQVIAALYARDYKVLHLAGHGVYRMWPPGIDACDACAQPLPAEQAVKRRRGREPVTGMIIGDGVVLSPKLVEQMRRVPELVFINCCHLGRMGSDPGASAESTHNDFNLLAANVATQFIRMGVRVVVAAGWAVDDSAAATFATTLYGRLCAGETFGAAVRLAREATYGQHPVTNTWGAYQCYGDPDYRLVRADGETPLERPRRLTSPPEAEAEIHNLAATLATRAGEDGAKERARLVAIEGELQARGWLDSGTLRVALARAYAEAGDLAQAIRHYEDAIACADGAISIHDIEQLTNAQARHAAIQAKADGDRKAAIERIDRAIAHLVAVGEALHPTLAAGDGSRRRSRARAAAGAEEAMTPEGLIIIGSAYKRKALLSSQDGSPTECAAALEGMKRHYAAAAAEAARRGAGPAPYPELNRIAAELAIAWAEAPAGTADAAERERAQGWQTSLHEIRSALVTRMARGREFFDAVMDVEVDLLEALCNGSVEGVALDAMVARYVDARRLGSARQFASVLDQLDFLIEMTKDETIRPFLVRLRAALVPAAGE